MQLPSKELLSEVLGGSDIEEIYIISNTLIFKYSHFINGHFQYRRKTEINIYELQHKCKEWAWNNGYGINTRRHTLHNGISCVIVYRNGIIADAQGVSDNEPEAIFQACQWILDNKDN